MLENVTLMESITRKKWDSMGYDIGGFLSHAGTPKSSIFYSRISRMESKRNRQYLLQSSLKCSYS